MKNQISMEEWKAIPDYEEYQVSTLGRVKRLAYYKNVCGGGQQYCEERILKPQKRKRGYQAVILSKNSKVKSFLIHRLVAMVFIPNPDNLPQVNHKDENTSNNCVDNLEWCNQCYNSNYGTSKYRISAKLKNGILSKPVEQYSKNGTFIMEYPSAIEASRVLGLNVSGIISCCNNNPKYSHCGNYQWRYEKLDTIEKVRPKKIAEDLRTRCCKQVDMYNGIVKVQSFASVLDAAKFIGKPNAQANISACALGKRKTAYGYGWTYVD